MQEPERFFAKFRERRRAKASGKRPAPVESSDSEEDSDFGNDPDEDGDESQRRAQKVRLDAEKILNAVSEQTAEEDARNGGPANATMEPTEDADEVAGGQGAFIKLLGDVKTKLENDMLLDAFFCQQNGVQLCKELKGVQCYFQVRKGGLYAITCDSSQQDFVKGVFRLSFACKIRFDNYTVWIDKIQKKPAKTAAIMIERKTSVDDEKTAFETLVLLPTGKRSDKLPEPSSDGKNIWDWFTAHFIKGERKTIARGHTPNIVEYGSDAYIVTGSSTDDTLDITNVVKVSDRITIDRLVALAKEGKLGTVKKHTTEANAKDKKRLETVYTGKDLKANFHLTPGEKDQKNVRAYAQTASKCFPAIGDCTTDANGNVIYTMTPNNFKYLSYGRNYDWNAKHRMVLNGKVKTFLLANIPGESDIQKWADFCIAELDRASVQGVVSATPRPQVGSQHPGSGQGGGPALPDLNLSPEGSTPTVPQQGSPFPLHSSTPSFPQTEISEDEGGTPTEIRGAAQAAQMEPLSPGNPGAPYALDLDRFTPLMVDGFNRGAAAATPAPAAGTPLHWQNTPRMQQPQNNGFNDRGTPVGIRLPTPAGTPSVGNYTPLSFGDTPYYTTPSATQAARDVLSPGKLNAAEALNELAKPQARFVDRCLSFY